MNRTFSNLLSALVLCASVEAASASDLLELGEAKAKETILAIGSAPVKKIKPLSLGALRTGEAQLPGGLLSRSERMQLRAKLALKRQRAVSQASRQNQKRKQQPNQNIQKRSSQGENNPVVFGETGEPELQ